ncbi:MAG: Ig-like domain-containing protein [Rudaea sp.]
MFYSNLRALRALLLRLSMAPALCLAATGVFAQSAPQSSATPTVALPVTTPTEYDGDLRDLPQTYVVTDYYRMLNEFESPPDLKPHPQTPSSPQQANSFPLAPMPAASATFAGVGYNDTVNGGRAGGGFPPDTNGDVGSTYYIQSVNTAIGIFDKTTGARTAAFTINQLWSVSGTSTVCLNKNDGDPVVLHDARNDRWILTDFAFGFSGSNPQKPFYQCIAVSKTGDPVSGGWYFYAVQMDTGASGGPPANTLNDYPKFGLWNDGCLYMGANGFTSAGGAYGGAIFASFNTANLYAGSALTSSIGYLPYNSANSYPFSMFPADLLGSSAGSLPPAGTPEYFVAQSQNSYAFNVRKFTPGANCGAGGTLGAAKAVNQTSFSLNSSTSDIVPQKGTAIALDSLEDRLMQRVQYRKIGSAESIWVVHSVGNGSSIVPTQSQWAQIDVTGGTVATTPVQQQIFAPDTTKSRWMAGIAVDGQGNAAMGYSRSSSTDYPSIYVAGRLVTDPLNDLPQSEIALVSGGGSQTNNCGGAACSRWGDYSSMTIDPTDDCTFWFTDEYYDTTANGSAGNWQTRIGSFKFPLCGVAPSTIGGSISGLTGTVQLKLDGTTPTSTQTQSFSANGSFTFSTALSAGSNWTVSVATQPTGQTCTVTNGTGTNLLANVTTVKVACTTNTYTIGGSISGLTGSVQLKLAGTSPTSTQTQTFPANGSVTFSTALSAGSNWTVSVTTQPTGQTCTVTNGTGTNLLTNVTTVKVACTTNTYTIGGSISGLTGSVQLKLDGTSPTSTQSQTFSANGSFTFSTALTSGSNWSVSVATQPTGQTCVVANGTGTNLLANVTTVTVACTTNTYTIGGSISGLTGSVQLKLDGTSPTSTQLQAFSANGSFTFSTGLTAGSNWTVSVATQPTGQTCVVANGADTNLLANVTTVTVACADNPPTQLVFVQQPTDGVAGVAINTVTVQVEDSLGNPVVGDSNSVTLSVTGAGPFASGSTTTAAFVNGVATFSNLKFDVAGIGYTLSATDAGDSLNAGPSDPFDIAAATADHLQFTPAPPNIMQGQGLGNITVTEYDNFNNVVLSDNSTPVTLTTGACGTITLGSGVLTGGMVNFATTLRFYSTATNVNLAASANGGPAPNPAAATFDVNMVSPVDIVFDSGFEVCSP